MSLAERALEIGLNVGLGVAGRSIKGYKAIFDYREDDVDWGEG